MATMFRLTSLAAATVLTVAGTSSLTAAGAAQTAVRPASSTAQIRPVQVSGVPGPAAAAGQPHAAAAAVGYTYWGFYIWDSAKSTWSYMKVGANDPSTSASTDGTVYGFRWALVVKDPRVPRAAGSFQQICGSTAKAAGKKRIGFVIDYGAPSDAANGDPTPAPGGLCASVGESATVQQALLAVTDVRVGSSGLICGIHGYPSTGCGSTVKNPTEPPPDQKVTLVVPGSVSPTTAPTTGKASPGSSPKTGTASTDSADSNSQVVVIAVGVVVVLALVGGALVLRRRSA